MSPERRRSLYFALLALAGLIVFAYAVGSTPTQTPNPTATPRPADLAPNQVIQRMFPSIGYAVHVSLWWDDHLRQRDLELTRQMRFQFVKQIFGWRDIRPDPTLPDQWAMADEVVAEVEYRGLKLIARLGKPPDWALRKGEMGRDDPPFDAAAFGDFCGDLAARYRGKIAGYQVWNEPNLDREWAGRTPSAVGYVRVLRECYQQIKANDPAAVVISAGLAPTGTYSPHAIPDDIYLVQLYQARMHPYYDVLGLNAPGYKSSPATPPDHPSLDGNRWQAFRHVEDMRAIMVAHGEGQKQVAILEMGWTTDTREQVNGPHNTPIPNPYRWHAVTEAQQAEYLLGAFEYAANYWRPWISLMTVIYLPDPYWTVDNEEYWWALADAGYNLRLRPAYFDLANGPRWIDETYSPPLDPSANPYTPMPPRKR